MRTNSKEKHWYLLKRLIRQILLCFSREHFQFQSTVSRTSPNTNQPVPHYTRLPQTNSHEMAIQFCLRICNIKLPWKSVSPAYRHGKTWNRCATPHPSCFKQPYSKINTLFPMDYTTLTFSYGSLGLLWTRLWNYSTASSGASPPLKLIRCSCVKLFENKCEVSHFYRISHHFF